MKRYTALTCDAERPALDIVLAFSTDLPITGIVDNDHHIVLYFDESDFSDAILDTIRSWLPSGADIAFDRGSVEEQNWNAEFEQSLQPVRVADRLIFTQSWNPVEPEHEEDLVIVIDPKMSFGTGHHESTRLISRLMMELDFRGKRVLDIGTGTGALAIIAVKLGAPYALAFDNNEWAVENAAENVALNDVPAEAIDVRLAELEAIEETGFDIILANMHRNIIIELLPQMVAKFPEGEQGFLLTSGVLFADYESLVDAARENGLHPVDEARENEWIATTWSRL